MGSYYEPKTKGIDDTAGGLVWVRRRNGSWWPGRILGMDEMPESCSASPRVGTPVKLLGREDGSMDWYNLEKSKRIKAFRCGEYDDCIEKAKASAGHSSKTGPKAGKYARREDAILHALEIEKAHNFHENQEFSLGIKNSTVATGFRCLLKEEDYNIARKLNTLESNSTDKLSQSVLSFEQTTDLNAIKVPVMQKKRWKTPNDSEDDGSEGTKRMRGLQDLGLGVAYNRKSSTVRTGGYREPGLPDNSSLSESNSSKDSCLSLKRRQPQVAHVHENLKRKNRRRQLAKVLESTARVSVPSICDQGGSSCRSFLQEVTEKKNNVLESMESKKTEYSEVINNGSDIETSSDESSLDAYENACGAVVDGTHFCSDVKDNEFSSMLEFVENDCSDGFLDIPVVWKEKQVTDFSRASPSSASKKLQLGAVEREDQCSGIEPISQSKGEETGSTSFAVQANHVRKRIDKGLPKGDIKGKNNLNCLSKNAYSRSFFDKAKQSEDCLLDGPGPNGSFDDFSSKVYDNSSDEFLTSDNGGQLANCRLVPEDTVDGSVGEVPIFGDSVNRNSVGHGSQSVEVFIQPADVGNILYNPSLHEGQKKSFFTRDVPVFPVPPRRSLLRRKTHPAACSCCQVADVPIKSSVGSKLYDVKLDVQAIYQGPRVPLVSLLSKLNGKAIVGHPITVKVLKYGHCDTLISSSDCCPAGSSMDMCAGRRKNETKQAMHIVNNHTQQDKGGNMINKLQVKTGHISHSKKNTQRKPSNHSIICSSLSRRKSSKIRKSGSLSRKIRRLSSITIDREHKEDQRKPVVEKLGGPSVACVPLKLVFSRINEALCCPSRPANCVKIR